MEKMNKMIITISREFGSGGRELGKRMADILGFSYYDKEIIAAISKERKWDEEYIDNILTKSTLRTYPITIGRTFSYPVWTQQSEIQIMVAQQRVIKALAQKGNCIVMGQGSDWILREYEPFNLFVYADMSAKIKRCKERSPKDEHFTDKELKKKIIQVDAGRAKRYEILTSSDWGRKENYHLCVNTTGIQIKTLAPQIAEYIKYWFGVRNNENTII